MVDAGHGKAIVRDLPKEGEERLVKDGFRPNN